jgi:hypothetical protein
MRARLSTGRTRVNLRQKRLLRFPSRRLALVLSRARVAGAVHLRQATARLRYDVLRQLGPEISWRDAHGTGVFVLKFASDGLGFQGAWTRKGATLESLCRV